MRPMLPLFTSRPRNQEDLPGPAAVSQLFAPPAPCPVASPHAQKVQRRDNTCGPYYTHWTTDDMLSNGARTLISSTFTAEPVGEVLAFWATRLGWEQAVSFAPCNQVFQQLLDPASELGRNDGVNVLLIRWDDLMPQPAPISAVELAGEELERAVRGAARRGAASFIIAFTRGALAVAAPAEIAALEETMAQRLEDVGTVHVIPAAWTDRHYPVAGWYDATTDRIGRVPYTPEYFAAIGTAVARKLHALRRRPHKVIVLDCDNTLWRGVVGEDGPDGVRITAPYQLLQQRVADQASQGRVLCLCSKNDEADVRAVFDSRPDMVLQWDQLVATRINWEPKPVNLEALAAELGLGLDSFIFLDDSPVECAAVAAALPDVSAFTLPADPAAFEEFLDHVWAFDVPRTTAEDRARGEMYRQNAVRERVRRSAPTLEDFLASLQLRVQITDLRMEDVRRAVQLTERTSQFNVTGLVRRDGELRELVASPEVLCARVDAADRFGDYGTVGLILASMTGDRLDVDTFLLSCRALGRGVEEQMVAFLGRAALGRGADTVHIRFRRTPRNEPAARFLEGLAAAAGRAPDAAGALTLPAAWAAAAKMDHARPAAVPPHGLAAAAARAAPVGMSSGGSVLQAITQDLRTASAVLAALRQESRTRPELQSTFIEPRSRTEQRIAGLWREVLRVNSAGIDDRFSDLGGSSLHLVRIHCRLLEEDGIELDLTTLFQHATIRALAAHIDGLATASGFDAVASRVSRQRAAFAQARSQRERRTHE
jgi:FkbH-like protein